MSFDDQPDFSDEDPPEGWVWRHAAVTFRDFGYMVGKEAWRRGFAEIAWASSFRNPCGLGSVSGGGDAWVGYRPVEDARAFWRWVRAVRAQVVTALLKERLPGDTSRPSLTDEFSSAIALEEALAGGET